MIGRCYYQLSGFEDNRKNPTKALEYEIKAYNYISQTKDTVNLARFIIVKGQIAIQERNNKELKT